MVSVQASIMQYSLIFGPMQAPVRKTEGTCESAGAGARMNRSQLCFLWKYQLLSHLCLNCIVQVSPSNGQAMGEKIISGIASRCVCSSVDIRLPLSL